MAYDFKNIVKEGERRRNKRKINPEPFEIDLGDEGIISVEYPDANTYLALGQAGEQDTLRQLQALFRNNPRGYNKLIDALDGQPIETISALVEAMWEHWDEDISQVPGKSKE